MKVAILLHAYQPPTQYPAVTKRITTECYRPLIETMMDYPDAKVIFNIVGSLSEQLHNQGDDDLLESLGYLASQGQISLTATAAYHPLLAAIPKDEMIRQIRINNEINTQLIGEFTFQPKGFFLPEMVYDESVGDVLAELGYSWVVLDESAHKMRESEFNSSIDANKEHFVQSISSKLYTFKHTDMNIFYRDSRLSLSMSFGQYEDLEPLKEQMLHHYVEGQESYVVLAMDAETFGHHQKHYIELFKQMIDDPAIELVLPDELMQLDLETVSVNPLRSTWGLITYDDQHKRRIFTRWMNPENELHGIQWRMFDLALGIGHDSKDVDLLDKAINSDFFWWSSKEPFWHPGMLKRSCDVYVDFVAQRLGKDSNEYAEMKDLADRLLTRGLELHGDKIID